ncbi:MAG: hypothetical protein WA790_02565 [Sulfitobacter sp.]
MRQTQEEKDLEARLTAVVTGTCNTVGCDNCSLKYGGYDSKECAATDLQGRLMDIQMKQYA